MKLNNPEDYRLLMREIIELDLNAVINKTDYLIVNWNENVLLKFNDYKNLILIIVLMLEMI